MQEDHYVRLTSFLIGKPDGRWLFWLHRAGGLALVVLLAWKAETAGWTRASNVSGYSAKIASGQNSRRSERRTAFYQAAPSLVGVQDLLGREVAGGGVDRGSFSGSGG
jgi:hypothetical protein